MVFHEEILTFHVEGNYLIDHFHDLILPVPSLSIHQRSSDVNQHHGDPIRSAEPLLSPQVEPRIPSIQTNDTLLVDNAIG